MFAKLNHATNAICAYFATKAAVRTKKERGDQLVELLLIILVACVLVVLFKDGLKEILDDLIKAVKTHMKTIFTNYGSST